MRVGYTDTALAEIDEICSYISKDNPAAAANVAAAIERTVEIVEPEIIIRNVRSTKRLRPWEREG